MSAHLPFQGTSGRLGVATMALSQFDLREPGIANLARSARPPVGCRGGEREEALCLQLPGTGSRGNASAMMLRFLRRTDRLEHQQEEHVVDPLERSADHQRPAEGGEASSQPASNGLAPRRGCGARR